MFFARSSLLHFLVASAFASAAHAAAPGPVAAPLPCRTTLDTGEGSLRERHFVYDDAGRLVLSFFDLSGVPTQVDSYRYSADGREVFRSRLAVPGSDEIEHTVRDARGRIVRVEVERAGRTELRLSVERDAAGRVVTRTRGTEQTRLTYGRDGRLLTEGPLRYEWSPTEPGRARRVGSSGVQDTVELDAEQRVIREYHQFRSDTGEPKWWTTYQWSERDEVTRETSWIVDPKTGVTTSKEVTPPRHDRFGNVIAGVAPRFDCPRDGVITLEQQDPANGTRLEDAPDGADLLIRGRLERGLRQGLWTVTTRAGPKLRELEFRDGLPTRAVTFFPSGARYEEGPYERGLRAGRWTRFWDNGRIREQGTFVAGRREGEFTAVAEDGEALPSFAFKAGEPVCTAVPPGESALRDGVRCEKRSVVHVRGGLKVGREIRLQPVESGAMQVADVASERHWLHDLLHGANTAWGPTGRLHASEQYWASQLLEIALRVDPSGAVMRPLHQLPVSRVIGLETGPASERERRELKLPRGVGLSVRSVLLGFPADRAGLQSGDVLVRANDAVLRLAQQLTDEVQKKGPLRLQVRRGSQTLSITTEGLAPPPPEATPSEAPQECAQAVARTSAALNAAGELVEDWSPTSLVGRAFGSGRAAERALECFSAAAAAPREQRAARACSNLATALMKAGRTTEALDRAWRCIEEDADPAVAARSWKTLGTVVPGAWLVASLLEPRSTKWSDLDWTPVPLKSKRLERRDLKTGRPELPLFRVDRFRSADETKEWLQLTEGAALNLADEPLSWPATVIPVRVRKDGCEASRAVEIVDGLVKITSTSEKDRTRQECEARVAPVGTFPLGPFLAVPLSRFSHERQLPPAVERAWKSQLESTRSVEDRSEAFAERAVAADDLDLDGELDWLVQYGRTIDVLRGGASPQWLGRLDGRELVRVRRDRQNGLRALVVVVGSGPEASAFHLYSAEVTSTGLRYIEVPYREEPAAQP